MIYLRSMKEYGRMELESDSIRDTTVIFFLLSCSIRLVAEWRVAHVLPLNVYFRSAVLMVCSVGVKALGRIPDSFQPNSVCFLGFYFRTLFPFSASIVDRGGVSLLYF